jgi:hypothetical protein
LNREDAILGGEIVLLTTAIDEGARSPIPTAACGFDLLGPHCPQPRHWSAYYRRTTTSPSSMKASVVCSSRRGRRRFICSPIMTVQPKLSPRYLNNGVDQCGYEVGGEVGP